MKLGAFRVRDVADMRSNCLSDQKHNLHDHWKLNSHSTEESAPLIATATTFCTAARIRRRIARTTTRVTNNRTSFPQTDSK